MKLQYCASCKKYTLYEKCSSCKKQTKDAHYKFVRLKGVLEEKYSFS